MNSTTLLKTNSESFTTTASLLVEKCEQFFNRSKELERAFTETDANQMEILLKDIVQRFDQMNDLMIIMKRIIPTELAKSKAKNGLKKKLKFTQMKQDRMNRPIVEEEVNERIGQSTVNNGRAEAASAITSIKNAEALSSFQFIEKLEEIAIHFADANGLSVDDIWQNMLNYALPEEHKEWVKENIIGVYTSWDTAKGAYLRQFPEEKKKLLKSRQERYVEYLLRLQMKEFDSLDEYNERFGIYCKNACMNLFDKSLFQRYIKSLLPKYITLLTDTLRKSTTIQPKSLYDLMELLSQSYEQIQFPIDSYPSPPLSYDDQLPLTGKRPSSETYKRPQKRCQF